MSKNNDRHPSNTTCRHPLDAPQPGGGSPPPPQDTDSQRVRCRTPTPLQLCAYCYASCILTSDHVQIETGRCPRSATPSSPCSGIRQIGREEDPHDSWCRRSVRDRPRPIWMEGRRRSPGKVCRDGGSNGPGSGKICLSLAPVHISTLSRMADVWSFAHTDRDTLIVTSC
jgi:hypothetical protein